MTQTVILRGKEQRTLAKRMIEAAPVDAVVRIAPKTHSLDQNALMWALLSDVSRAKPMAQKPPDFLAVFACSACHDALDRRHNGEAWGFDDLLRALGETLIRQNQLGNYGYLR